MEGAELPSLSACLLQWVQSFDGVGRAEALQDLSDGRVLWSVLHEVDPEHFSGELPEPDVSVAREWTRKWQNLKHVEKQVAMYYRDICDGQEHIKAEAAPDLKAIAAESTSRDLEKLIMIIIRIAMASPASNEKMVQKLMGLGRGGAMVVATELRNMEEEDVEESEPVSRDESAYQSEQEVPEHKKVNGTPATSSDPYQDPLLEREQELLQAQAMMDKMEANQSSLLQQIQDLRQDKERLQEAFNSYRDEIDSKGRKNAGDETFKKLQRQADNDKVYIDDLETQLQSSRNSIENYERQIQRHRDETEAGQKLRDELQMLKADNEDLNQKIKANENLKKKIQTLQEQEKANLTLREEVKVANERLEELDRLKHFQAGLEKEIIEKKGLIRNQEYQINELTTTRRHIEYEAKMLSKKLEEARERHDRDHEALEDLRAKLQGAGVEDMAEEEPAADQSTQDIATLSEPTPKPTVQRNDEGKHLAEKVALLEQQLESADARLKQAAGRSAAFEEQQRNLDADSEARQKAEQRAQEQDEMIANLRKELEAAAKSKADTTAIPQDAAALQRENHLMATAWYDLSTRLQNNGISLGRRRQEPKSWIGKQRALVGPASSVR